jgi:CheY-like chemotaxis protein
LTSTNYTKPSILIAREKLANDSDLAGLILNKNISLLRAESGPEALLALQKNPALSLAMINADLPGLNGFDTAIEIRKLSPGIPIILLVNYVNTDSIRLSILTDCTRMLQNPVDPDELNTIVEQNLIKRETYV